MPVWCPAPVLFALLCCMQTIYIYVYIFLYIHNFIFYIKLNFLKLLSPVCVCVRVILSVYVCASLSYEFRPSTHMTLACPFLFFQWCGLVPVLSAEEGGSFFGGWVVPENFHLKETRFCVSFSINLPRSRHGPRNRHLYAPQTW